MEIDSLKEGGDARAAMKSLSAMKSVTLKSGFIWALGGNTAYFFSKYAVLIVMAKIGNPVMMGQFALGLAISTPIFLFMDLALRPVMVTDPQRRFHFIEYLTVRVASSLAGCAIVAAIAGISNNSSETKLVVITVAMLRALESLSDIYYAVFQLNKRLDIVSISQILKSTLSISALTIVLYVTNSVVLSVIAFLLPVGLLFLVFDLYWFSRIGIIEGQARQFRSSLLCQLIRRFRSVWRSRPIQQLVRLAFPLGGAVVLSSFAVYIPSYFVKYYYGEAVLGIFAAISSFMRVNGLVVNSLGQAAVVRLSEHFGDQERTAFSRLLTRLVLLGVSIGLLGILVAAIAGKYVLAFFFQPEFGRYSMVLVIFMATSTLENIAVFLGFGMTAGRMLKIQPLVFFGSVVTSVVSSFLLIPSQQILGAAIVFGVISLFRIAGSLVCIQHILRFRFN